MEELETLESTECPECPGPPPEFRLPPPPRPPFLTEGSFCSEAPLADLEDCVAVPIIDASYHTNPSLQSTALIITCAVVVLLMAAIISVVFWKHKRKVQNLLPCKSATGATAVRGPRILGDGSGQPRTVPMTGAGGAVLYEDLADATLPHSQLHNHHRLTPSGHHHQYQAPTIEMLDVKDGGRGVFVCSSPRPDTYASQDLYNPVYEELSNGDHPETDEESELNARNRLHYHYHRHHHHHHRLATSKPGSEDEFAEDELSVGEPSEGKRLTSSVVPTWGTCPAGNRPPRERRGRSPKSLDRRRRDKSNNRDVGEFHEGMLLDALLQLYPNVASHDFSSDIAGTRTNHHQQQQQQQQQPQKQTVPSVAHRLPYYIPPMPAAQALRVEENPYESIPVLDSLHHYSSQTKNNKESNKSRKSSAANTLANSKLNSKNYSNGSQYYTIDQDQQDSMTPLYTQVGDDYSDSYSQPTDRLYNDDKYTQPVYQLRDNDQTTVPTGRLYQGQPDSSFGSDSGYSHHTTGTTGTRGSNSRTTPSTITTIATNHRNNKDKHRNSHHSHHPADFIVS